MDEKIKIIGYHGTFSENVCTIIEEGYETEYRDNHWLGQGIYFYDNYDLALWFINRKRKDYCKNVTVIKSVIYADVSKILNLDTIEGVDFFYKKLNELWSEFRTIEFNEEDENSNRCLILDALKEYYEIDIIIKTFETDKQTYGSANVNWFEKNNFPVGIKYSEKQICVTGNNCIISSEAIEDNNEYNIPKRIFFQYYKKRK